MATKDTAVVRRINRGSGERHASTKECEKLETCKTSWGSKHLTRTAGHATLTHMAKLDEWAPSPSLPSP
jgi:hypothetical protein